ncbi:cell division protein FtsZ [bacterium]|nr:cell division protein FtsZ [bacterium]
MAEVKPSIETFAKIKVVGVGGSGGSAVNRMVDAKVPGVDFLAINTDVQALHHSRAKGKLQIGKTTTRGLGSGMNPEVGRKSAEENQNEIRETLRDSDMVFITCGMGGGTGSGASSTVADLARDAGALTVAVVTKPFSFEGAQRSEIADAALAELKGRVDAIIVIPNDRLMQVIDKKTSLLESFRTCDEVLHQGVRGIAELITVPGLINVDFADVKAILQDAGSALMGIGHGEGDSRAMDAANAAIENPLLDLTMDGAKGILFTVAGSSDMTMHEVNEAAKIITSAADPNAKIIFGAVIDPDLKDGIRITVVATGFSDKHEARAAVAAGSRPANYEPTSFLGRGAEKLFGGESNENKVEQPPEPRPSTPVVPPKRSTSVVPENSESSPPDGEDGELEIPAFIRKKMR